MPCVAFFARLQLRLCEFRAFSSSFHSLLRIFFGFFPTFLFVWFLFTADFVFFVYFAFPAVDFPRRFSSRFVCFVIYAELLTLPSFDTLSLSLSYTDNMSVVVRSCSCASLSTKNGIYRNEKRFPQRLTPIHARMRNNKHKRHNQNEKKKK